MTTPADAPEPDWVWDVLARARWFSGRGRGGRVSAIHPLETWDADAPAVRSWRVRVDYPCGAGEDYQVVVEHTPQGPAEPSPAAWQRLCDSVLGNLQRVRGLPADLRPGLAARAVEGEQSHTSLLLGTVGILKLYRTLEATPAVSDHADRLHAAPVPRRYLLSTFGPQHLRVLSVSQQIPNAVDGWELATAAAAHGQSFAVAARRLGEMLHQVHTALSPPSVPQRSVDGSVIAAGMHQRLTSALTEVPDLESHAAACRAAFDALAGRRIPVQTIHGDAHLGQALRDGDGKWWLTDFDGEPLKSPAQRQAPDSPLRDVSGMSLSFAYAAHHGGGDLAWTRTCQSAFLTGYGDTGTDAVRRAYAVDKAVYNMVYETRNRPGWIPLAHSVLTESLAQGVR